MDTSLRELQKAMPPLKNPRSTKVNWDRLESRVGLPYPDSFKEYVSNYGETVWCGNWFAFYDDAKKAKELEEFVQSMTDFVGHMRGNMHHWDDCMIDIELPLYPEKDGLLPFLVDYNNSIFCWKTSNLDPDKWPVVCWVDRGIIELRGITISGIFLGWLQRTRRMIKVWGDPNDIKPDDLSLNRG